MSVVALCSGKGAPGATFVAVNLAAAIARRGEETVLVDLDPNGGDVAAYLRLDPRRGLYPLLRMESRAPDGSAIMREAEQRGDVLAVCGFPDVWPSANGLFGEILRRMPSNGRWVLADLGCVSEANAKTAMETDLVLLVVRPDLISVSGAERSLRVLLDAGVAASRIQCIVSGFDRRRPGDLAEVASALRLPVLGSLPFDRTAARQMLVSQNPLSRGRLAGAFDALGAAVLAAVTVEHAPTAEVSA